MIGLFLLLGLSAAGEHNSEFDAFFAEFAEKRNGIHALEAEFTYESKMPDETMRTRGQVVYVRPKRIVLRFEEPHPTYLVDELRVYVYEPDLKQLQIDDLEDEPQTEAFFLGFDDDGERLRQAYAIELFDPEGEPEGARGVILRPKTSGDEDAYFDKVVLWLRAEDYLPYRVQIMNDSESETIVFQMTNFVINGTLKADQAQISLPEGTTIIEYESIAEVVGAGGKRVPSASVLREGADRGPSTERTTEP